eukprot:462220-Prorocentrum_minimum.AAC.1
MLVVAYYDYNHTCAKLVWLAGKVQVVFFTGASCQIGSSQVLLDLRVRIAGLFAVTCAGHKGVPRGCQGGAKG